MLFFIDAADRIGGAENFLYTLLRHCDRERLSPEVALFDGGCFAPQVAALGVPVHLLPPARLRQLGRAARTGACFAAVLHRRQPDLVVSWTVKAQLLAAPAIVAFGLRSRALWWQHDFPRARTADRVATTLPAIAIGTCSTAVLVEQSALWPHRACFSVLPGIDAPPELSRDERRMIRAELAIDPHSTLIGLAGRLIPWKGQDRLLEATALMRAAGHDVHALIVGTSTVDTPAGFEEALHARAERDDLRGAVSFVAVAPGADRYIQAMDICVNASQPEPFGIVLLEAMATGIPVVAVDAGGPREIVEPGRSGLLASSGSAADLTAAIAPLIGDYRLRQRLAQGGRQRYRSRFTAARMARDVEDRLGQLRPTDLPRAH